MNNDSFLHGRGNSSAKAPKRSRRSLLSQVETFTAEDLIGIDSIPPSSDEEDVYEPPVNLQSANRRLVFQSCTQTVKKFDVEDENQRQATSNTVEKASAAWKEVQQYHPSTSGDPSKENNASTSTDISLPDNYKWRRHSVDAEVSHHFKTEPDATRKPIYNVSKPLAIAYERHEEKHVPYKTFQNFRMQFDFNDDRGIFDEVFKCVGCPVVNLTAGSYPRLLECMHSICRICLQSVKSGCCPECFYVSEKTYPHFILNALCLIDSKKAQVGNVWCGECKYRPAKYAHEDGFSCYECDVGFVQERQFKNSSYLMQLFKRKIMKEMVECFDPNHRYTVIGYSSFTKDCYCHQCITDYAHFDDSSTVESAAADFLALAETIPPFDFDPLKNKYAKETKQKFFAYVGNSYVNVPMIMKTPENKGQTYNFVKALRARIELDFNDLIQAQDKYNDHLRSLYKLLHLCGQLVKHEVAFKGVAKHMPAFQHLVANFKIKRWWSGKTFVDLLPKIRLNYKEKDPRLSVALTNSICANYIVNRKRATVVSEMK